MASDLKPIEHRFEKLEAYPLSVGNEIDSDPSFTEAKRNIARALIHGQLKAYGRKNSDMTVDGEWNYSEIPIESWEIDQISWDRDHLNSQQYVASSLPEIFAIRVKTAELLELFPGEGASDDLEILGAPTNPDTGATSEESGYTTPYIELIKQAIKHHQISDTNQPKKQPLVDWLMNQSIEGEKVSGNLAKPMATFLRLPKMQKGRAAKIKK